MRLILTLGLMLTAVSAQANSVLLDFDESGLIYECNDSHHANGCWAYTQGYLVSGGNLVGTIGDQSFTGTVRTGFDEQTIRIDRIDGSLFTLHSFDFDTQYVDLYIEGFAADGTRIYNDYLEDRSVCCMSGNWASENPWLNLSYLEITGWNGGIISGGFVNVDNIHASAVPVPAAVWLFGSGLGLLGWFRRRQTA